MVYILKNTRCLCIFTIQRNIFHAISSLIWIITCGFGRSTNVGSISKLEWFLWITSTELLHSLAHKSLYCKNSFKRHWMKSVTIVKRTIWTMPINSLRIKKVVRRSGISDLFLVRIFRENIMTQAGHKVFFFFAKMQKWRKSVLYGTHY